MVLSAVMKLGAVRRAGVIDAEAQAYVARILGLMGGASALPPDASFEVRLVS